MEHDMELSKDGSWWAMTYEVIPMHGPVYEMPELERRFRKIFK